MNPLCTTEPSLDQVSVVPASTVCPSGECGPEYNTFVWLRAKPVQPERAPQAAAHPSASRMLLAPGTIVVPPLRKKKKRLSHTRQVRFDEEKERSVGEINRRERNTPQLKRSAIEQAFAPAAARLGRKVGERDRFNRPDHPLSLKLLFRRQHWLHNPEADRGGGGLCGTRGGWGSGGESRG